MPDLLRMASGHRAFAALLERGEILGAHFNVDNTGAALFARSVTSDFTLRYVK